MQKKLLIPIVLIFVALAWAGSFIVVNKATEEIDPIALGFLRFVVSTPVMILYLLISKRDLHIPRKELPSLIVLGLSGVTFLYLTQFTGIHYTNASTASVLINTNVIFIALLSFFFLQEILNKRKIAGISLSFLGVIIIIISNNSLEEFSANNLFIIGSVLIILCAFCWAVYSIVGKRLLKTYDMFTVSTYAFILGTVFYLPFVITTIIPTIERTSFASWMAVLYLALVCTIFGYMGWYYVLKHTEASKAAVYLNLIPLFTISISFFLGEPITAIFLLGAIFIIYGVYITQKS